MAGDWIKIRTDLYEDQDVLQMSDILGTDDPTTIGLLVRFWSWADKQTIDGNGIKLSDARIDSLVGRPGFADALRKVEWLEGENGSLTLPNFQRHNGDSAKARVLEAEAKRIRRKQQKPDQELSDTCPTISHKKVGPEKRRDREEIPPLLFPQEGEDHEGRFLPKGWKNMSRDERKRRRVQANSPAMVTIGGFFGRREGTLWTVAEAVALLEVRPTQDEVILLSRYYAEPLDKDADYRRRDLSTLLNNWQTEVDRARSHYANTSAA